MQNSGTEQETTAGAAESGGWLAAPQKRLGTVGLIVFLAVANLLVPFSVDIYTPSLPEMPGYFNTNESVVNLTLVLFYLFFAIALFAFGALSDKVGRKPVLVAGNAVYVAGSLACALSFDIAALIGARVVQALGAGAVYAVATALVDDCFTARKRVTVLTVMQVLFVIGPVVAPLAGGVIILFGTWREVFLVLAGAGVLCLVGSLLFAESLPAEKRLAKGVIAAAMGCVQVLRNRRFVAVLMVMSMFNLMFMAYVAAGAYIYVDGFGQTQQVFTYFFAATAAIAALGPVVFQRVGGNVDLNRFTYVLIIVTAASGIGILILAPGSMWAFTVMAVIFCAATMTMRPYTINMMLEMSEGRAGAASSALNFVSTLLGAAGMVVVMLFGNLFVGLAVTVIASMAISLVFWTVYVRS